MTTSETTTVNTATPSGMSADAQAEATANAAQLPDARPQLRAALALAVSTVRNVRTDQLGNPTPCTEYDVDGLIRHLAGAADRAVAAAAGGTMADLDEYAGVPAAGVAEELAHTAAAFTDAWSDDATLDQVIELPWATLPARVLLAIYLAEVSTHTWDVAAATGQQPAFDQAALEIALATMQIGLPAEGREQTPFAAVRPVADDAPAIDRLVAWTGRNPAWPAA